MGVRFPFTSITNSNTTVATNIETILLTLPPFSPPVDAAQVILLAEVVITSGTGTTAILLQIKRGTTTGGAVITSFGGNAGRTAVAGNVDIISRIGFDNPGIVAGQQYVLTATQTSGSANGTANSATLMAFVL